MFNSALSCVDRNFLERLAILAVPGLVGSRQRSRQGWTPGEHGRTATWPAVLLLCAVCILAGASLPASAAQGQGYPNRPVRFVVGFSPGGSNDLVARVLGAKLSDALGQQFVIDNRPGAGGIIANSIVSTATPDGHTILLVPVSFSYESVLHQKLAYDPQRDFAPVSLIATAPFIFLTNVAFPANNIEELVSLAKANPGKINSAHAGVGNFTHLTMELLKLATGIKLTAVTYKGSGPGLVALIAGEVQITSTALPPAMPLVRAGRVRALAVTSQGRARLLPDVPTVAESGVRGYDAVGWWGVVAPAGTPRAILKRLETEIARTVQAPGVRDRLARVGAEAVGSSADAFAARISAEHAKWGKVIRDADIKVR